VNRKLVVVAAAALAAWCAWGLRVRAGRPERPPPPAGELRGVWHVHTTASDGRGTLDEVIAAARGAGLQFVVVSDHNVLGPAAPAWRDGVLVVPATEASTRYGHVVAAGVPRPLDGEERRGDPLGAIAALGGQAVLAHPLHPERPFGGWGTGPWRGFEVVSNDTAWYRALAERSVGRILRAALMLPWDPPSTVLTLAEDPSRELARFDAELAAARAVVPASAGRPPASLRVLLCSADAHGWPSYGAAFGAFSMHVPVAGTGDAAADARAVLAALLDGSAACVLDGIAPASGVRLHVAPAPGTPDGLVLELAAPTPGEAEAVLLHDGVPIARAALAPGAAPVTLSCGGRCAPGDYRVEVRRGGRPWIFTNPVAIE
jgi:hypothetical protein